MSSYVCTAPKCRFAESPTPCKQWQLPSGCAQGKFRKLVSEFAQWGDWDVHECPTGSNKYYAKLFGPKGFVTIEDYTFSANGFTVSVRLKNPKNGRPWSKKTCLSHRDWSLADAVAWGCARVGLQERMAL